MSKTRDDHIALSTAVLFFDTENGHNSKSGVFLLGT